MPKYLELHPTASATTPYLVIIVPRNLKRISEEGISMSLRAGGGGNVKKVGEGKAGASRKFTKFNLSFILGAAPPSALDSSWYKSARLGKIIPGSQLEGAYHVTIGPACRNPDK